MESCDTSVATTIQPLEIKRFDILTKACSTVFTEPMKNDESVEDMQQIIEIINKGRIFFILYDMDQQ